MTEKTAEAEAAVEFFITYKDPDLRAYPSRELFDADHPGVEPITTVEGLENSDIPLAAIVASFNKISAKKVRGFKDRKEGAKTLVGALQDLIRSMNAPKATTEDTLTKALKPKKEPKVKKEKVPGSAEGRNSPLSGKFWSRSNKAISGRRLGGSGVGIKALQYIIDNPGCTTDDYLANSGGGRFVDLQYDLDHGNIVMLEGATAEERAAEIEALAKVRVGAEKAAEEAAAKEAKAKAEKKAAAEKAAEEKKAKAAEEKKAKAEAKAKEEAAKADAK